MNPKRKNLPAAEGRMPRIPFYPDGEILWSYHRAAASKRKGTLALIGASRMQTGTVLSVFAERRIRPVRMLAVDGSCPLPLLWDLSEDLAFKGSVLCSFMPGFMADGRPWGERTAKWIRKYRAKSVADHLAFVLRLVKEPLGRAEPAKIPMGFSRFRYFDPSSPHIPRMREARLKIEKRRAEDARPLSAGAFEKRVERIREAVCLIRERGGTVAFLRFPSSGEILSLEERTYPRKIYWDVFAERVGACAIHFADHREFDGLTCPDGSHLDFQSAALFTERVIALLETYGFFKPVLP